jgi:hypothetical protein
MNGMVPPNSIIRISRLDVEWPKTWRVISPEVDEQGAYASELIAPGDYKVSVLYDGKPFLGAGVRYSGTLYRETTVQSEEVVQTDFIVEHGSGGITGRLSASAESGLSMAGPFLFAAALYRIGDIAIEESVEVEDLTYAALDLPAGPVTLFVQTMGSNGVVYHYEDVVIESGTIVKRDINVDAGGAMTINVDPPMTEHTLVIDIERVAGGHYSRSIGDRFPNYTSWLPPFHVYGLAPGTYEVRVFDSANEETPIPLMEPMLFDVTRSEHFIFEIDRSVSETSGDGTTDEGLSD